MKQYTVKCHICGHENHGLYLEETEGWFVCEKCKNEVGIITHMTKVPFFTEINKKTVLDTRN